MNRCIIFCAADFDSLLEPIGDGELVLAADGGLRHLSRLGIVPQVILGDFDSLGYVPEGAQVFPVEKDDTDAMLAARLGLSRGCREFVIYGGLGGSRLDHTVANLQMLRFLADHGAWGCLVGTEQMVTVIREGKLEFPAGAEGIISVFCMGEKAEGVTLRGLQYELKNGSLHAGFPLGVSNHFVGRPAEISVDSGSLLVIWERQAALPVWKNRPNP